MQPENMTIEVKAGHNAADMRTEVQVKNDLCL